MKKVALITGITGQDGSYLAELLLEKGYDVHGIKRRSSSLNTERIDHLYQSVQDARQRLFLHYGDLSDSSNLTSIIQKVQPDEIYNLGAQAHAAVSFDSPEYTADVDGLGALRILEAIRFLKFEKKHVSIRRLRPSYSDWCRKYRSAKLRCSIPARLTLAQSSMRTG